MKNINLKGTLLSTDGVTELLKPDGSFLNYGEVLGIALTSTLVGDDKLNGEEKYRIFKLAKRIIGEDHVELSREEIDLLLSRVATTYGSWVVGQIYELFE